MKVMKSIKGLKFWSRKKKKRKTTIDHHSPPICCCCPHHHHHSRQTVQPSAPPLPTWLDYQEPTYGHNLLASQVNFSSFQEFPSSNETHFDPQKDEITEPINPSSSSYLNLPGEAKVETEYSYQQYMAQNPVYPVPVLPTIKRYRSAGAIGCVLNTGAHLFQCFCPCFRIREA